ncbi:hypothetical protein D3C72_909580 [compost metagenome]
MPGGQIGDVDIVAHGRAVGGVIVGAADLEVVDLAQGGHHGAWDQMGLDRAEFADVGLGRGAAGVEVAQGHGLQAMSVGGVAQHGFAHQLGPAIGADRGGGQVLADHCALRVAIDGAGAGEDQPVHARRPHPLDQTQQAGDVVAVVVQRRCGRLADHGGGGELHDGGHVVLDQGAAHQRGVRHIALDQRPPAHELGMAGRQIVQRHRPIARLRQGLADVAADIAGAARDQDGGAFRMVRRETHDRSISG